MQYVLKDLSVDTETRTVRRDEITFDLPDLSFDVLIKLLQQAPEPVSISEFSKEVWRAGHVSDETVAQRITLLRKALGDNPKSPTYIRTVRGSGYAALGPVTLMDNVSSKFNSTLTRHILFATSVGLVLFVFTLAFFSGEFGIHAIPESKAANLKEKSTNTIHVERAKQQLSLHQARETDRAIAMLREVLTLEPKRFDARLTLSFALSTKATKFGGGLNKKQEAEALARGLINEQPESSNAWSALAYSLSSQGRVDESLPAYEYAYQLNPQNAPAISSAAYLHLTKGNLHQALLLENQAKQSGGKSRYAEIQITQILELIGHPAAAEWRARALSLNPGQVVILSEIAKWHLRQGNPQTALEVLDLAEGDDQFAPQLLQLRSRAAILLGNIDQAKQHLNATGDYGHFDMTLLNAISGDVTPAKELLLTKLANLEADATPDTRIQLAELSAAVGRNDQALKLIAQAVNLGWRDANWLKQSPFIGSLMSSSEGLKIESRIKRELEGQRRLIERSEELSSYING